MKADKSESDRLYRREMMRQRRTAARDIEIPQLTAASKRRRARTKHDPMKFAKTYFDMDLPYSKLLHVVLYETVGRIIKHGGNQAIAAPRGHGKDSTLKIIIVWALLHGWLKFVLLICANKEDAVSRLSDIRLVLETNEKLCEDFPEVCVPIRALEGAAQRAKSQTVSGKRTRIEWHANEIRLPDVDGSVSSGSWLMARGIDGQILGIVREDKRPQFYIVSDPETEESVESQTMTGKIRKKLDRGLAHIGGPGKKLSGVILCTIRKKGCVADEFTDPKKRPAWAGKRFQAFISWPENKDLWQKYVDQRKEDQQEGDSDGRKAHALYLENRKAMDAGAVPIWPENYVRDALPDGSMKEVSAIQGYYNIIADYGMEAFSSEYQNDPMDVRKESGLDSLVIQSKQNDFPHLVVPDWATHLTQGIDLRATEMHWVTIAWKQDDATGHVIDYAIQPYGVAQDTDATVALDTPLLRVIMTALRQRRESSQGLYVRENGDTVPVDLTGIDSGWKPEVVYAFVRESGPKWLAIDGRGKGSGRRSFSKPVPGEGRRVGQNWWGDFRESDRLWLWHLNADHWKHYVHEGLMQHPGTPGSLALFRDNPKNHRTFAHHMVAEEWDPIKAQWEVKSKWNHFLDCTAYACGLADILGIKRIAPSIADENRKPREPQPRQAPQTSQHGWVRRGGAPWFNRGRR